MIIIKYFRTDANEKNENAAPSATGTAKCAYWPSEIYNNFERYSHNHFQHIALYLGFIFSQLCAIACHVNGKTSKRIEFQVRATHKAIAIEKTKSHYNQHNERKISFSPKSNENPAQSEVSSCDKSWPIRFILTWSVSLLCVANIFRLNGTAGWLIYLSVWL